MSTKLKFPTEIVSLPSKGKLYPSDSPLSKGEIEMKYMTAKEEDILTNINYLENGTVIDKLLQSLIVTEGVNLDEMFTGDKDAILVGARILGYGKEYETEYKGSPHTIDLTQIQEKPLHPDYEKATENKFSFKLPKSEVTLEFKLLNGKDEKEIEKEIKGLEKIKKGFVPESVTRYRQQILSIDGDDSPKTINEFTENYFLSQDTRAFRQYLLELQPGLDLNFYPEDGPEGGVRIPIGIRFFWPDAEL